MLNKKRGLATIAAVGIAVVALVVGIAGGYSVRSVSPGLTSTQTTTSLLTTTLTYTDTSEIDSLQSIISIQDSQSLATAQSVNWPTLGGYSFNIGSISYSGYILVSVSSSTDTNTQVQVSLSNSGFGLSTVNTVKVGSSGSANFPVFPTSNLIVKISDQLGASGSATVSITYYY